MREAPFHRRVLIAALDDHDAARSTERLLGLLSGRALPGLGAAATLHGVDSYLFRRVQHLPGVDADLVADLELRHHQRLQWSLRSLADLTKVYDVLAGVRSPWLVSGGLVWSELLYPQPEMRGAVTFDLITPQRTLRLIVETLERSDCRRIIPDVQLAPLSGLAEVRMLLWHGTVVRVGSMLVLPASGEQMWVPEQADAAVARARIISLHDIRLPTLDAADTLLSLTGRSDRVPGGLGRLKDIERASRIDAPDWDDFTARARAYGIAGGALHQLRAARRLLHAPIPDGVVRSIPASRIERSGSQGSRTRTGREPVETALLHLVSRDPKAPPPLSEPEWLRLVHLAVREHAAPLAWTGLQAVGGSSAPGSIVELLRQASDEAATAAAHAYRTLDALLGRWRQRGVAPILLKGAALARSVYSDPALRPFWDVDILVDPADISATHEILIEAGYDLAGAVPTAADITWRHGRGYYDPGGLRPSVDVHWRYLGYPLLADIDYKGISDRAHVIRVGEETVRVPAPADQVVMSGIYFVRELWYGKSRLRYVRDLAEIATGGSVDWDVVHEQVGRTPTLRSAVFLGLSLAHRLLHGVDPRTVMPWARPLEPPRMKALINRAELKLLRPYAALDSVREITLLRWLDDPSPSGMVRWALSLLFIPSPLKPSRIRWLRRLGGLPG